MAKVSDSTFDRAEYLRRENAQRAKTVVIAGHIQDMRAGFLHSNVPWGDPDFQKAVVMALAEGAQWRRDSEKLAIVKEVFGGKG